MGGGRKNLKRAVEDDSFTLQQGQALMQVLSLRGSNLIEVMDAKGEKSLAFFPAKFQKSMWIKRGSYVVVDESGKEEALESGSKVGCIVSQVLFHEQIRRLQKTSEWPEVFKSETIDNSIKNFPVPVSKQDADSKQEAEESDLSDDDGLPPLEANMNRWRPCESNSGSDSDENTDTEEQC